MPRLETGGAERSAIEIAAALVQSGFAALVASEGGRLVGELEKAGGEWIPFPADTKAPHRLLHNSWRLREIVRSRNVQLLHARSRAPAWSGLWAARHTGIPYVTTHHGSYSARSALKRFYNSVMVRSDAVIANSQWTADHIRAQYRTAPGKLVVIPRGVDLAQFDAARVSPERVEALRKRWLLDAEDFAVLLPGRLTRWKGQLVLIEAAAHVSGRMRVVLAGDAQGRSDYEQELQHAIAARKLNDHVSIVGHVSDMPAAYLAADVVVSASTQEEAFGRVAAEASAMGRPVIATDHGGARETIRDQETGLLVPPGDGHALSAALERLMSAGAQGRAAMGLAGREHIAKNFTVERMCADTLALYRELMARTPG